MDLLLYFGLLSDELRPDLNERFEREFALTYDYWIASP